MKRKRFFRSHAGAWEPGGIGKLKTPTFGGLWYYTP